MGKVANGYILQEERGDRSFWLITLAMTMLLYHSPLESLIFPVGFHDVGWMKFCGAVLVGIGTGLFIWVRHIPRVARAARIYNFRLGKER